MSEKRPQIFAGVVVTVLAVIGWLIYMLLHILYWSKDFTLFENLVIGFVSFLVVGLLICLMWIIGAYRYGYRYAELGTC